LTKSPFQIELATVDSGRILRRSQKPSCLSLFSGAGGLDFGLEAAGFQVALAVERDEACCKTLRANRRWPILESDIADIEARDVLKASGLRRRNVDLLTAGPPCQPFSKSANWSPTGPRGLADPRADAIHRLLDVIEAVLPRCVLIENVEGFQSAGRESGLTLALSKVREINRRWGTDYRPTWRVLNAAHFGVPQLRKRFFLIAFRDGTEFDFPEPSVHSPVTSWETIGPLSKKSRPDLGMKGRWADLLRTIPEGHNYLWHTARGGGASLFGWRTRYWSFLLKLAKKAPAWTIPAHPAQNAGPFHWHNRQLSTAEMLRLQTFPQEIIIQGSRSDRQRLIGNAVPSLLAETIGRHLSLQLGYRKRLGGPYRLSVQRFQEPIPEPEALEVIREQYLGLIGVHNDHPGTGLGPQGRREQANLLVI
jgi:DNA (cytosine-5)-methyltransferase 1